MKKTIAVILIILLNTALALNVFAKSEEKNGAEIKTVDKAAYEVNARSAVLMEASTGTVLYAFNEESRYSPASVTKIMTLLIIMEAVSEGKIDINRSITVSDYAASMGGSQIFLEEGEEMSVKDLIKSTVIASANDAAVALAEHVAGSEKLFVNIMNKRAGELGLKNTHFENVTGLDDTTENHMTSAMDIALMSRELLKHDLIKEFSTKWQDTIRDGEFTLTNTNRLVRYYDGCTGLKTGSTNKAGYCLSATAFRDGMELIAVIMGAETRDIRNAEAKSLLDYGFANYALYSEKESFIKKLPVVTGEKSYVDIYQAPFETVIDKGNKDKIEKILDVPEEIAAPILENQKIGTVVYKLNGVTIGSSDIYSKDNIKKANVMIIFSSIIKEIFS